MLYKYILSQVKNFVRRVTGKKENYCGDIQRILLRQAEGRWNQINIFKIFHEVIEKLCQSGNSLSHVQHKK